MTLREFVEQLRPIYSGSLKIGSSRLFGISIEINGIAVGHIQATLNQVGDLEINEILIIDDVNGAQCVHLLADIQKVSIRHTTTAIREKIANLPY